MTAARIYICTAVKFEGGCNVLVVLDTNVYAEVGLSGHMANILQGTVQHKIMHSVAGLYPVNKGNNNN